MSRTIHGVQNINEICPNLYLTSIYGATKENISRRNVTLLINAAQELPKMDLPNVETIKLFLDDTPYALISVYFDRIADKIHEHLNNGGRVLVHCVLGVSRSTSLCLAYFMKYKNMSLKQAFDSIASKRPCARPNPGFWRQLIDFEKKLINNKITMLQQQQSSRNNSSSNNSTAIPINIMQPASTKGYLFNSGSMPLLKPGSLNSNTNNGWMGSSNTTTDQQSSRLYKNSARNSARHSATTAAAAAADRQSVRNKIDTVTNLYKSLQVDGTVGGGGTASYQIPANRSSLLVNQAATTTVAQDYLNKPGFSTTYRSSYGTTR